MHCSQQWLKTTLNHSVAPLITAHATQNADQTARRCVAVKGNHHFLPGGAAGCLERGSVWACQRCSQWSQPPLPKSAPPKGRTSRDEGFLFISPGFTDPGNNGPGVCPPKSIALLVAICTSSTTAGTSPGWNLAFFPELPWFNQRRLCPGLEADLELILELNGGSVLLHGPLACQAQLQSEHWWWQGSGVLVMGAACCQAHHGCSPMLPSCKRSLPKVFQHLLPERHR